MFPCRRANEKLSSNSWDCTGAWNYFKAELNQKSSHSLLDMCILKFIFMFTPVNCVECTGFHTMRHHMCNAFLLHQTHSLYRSFTSSNESFTYIFRHIRKPTLPHWLHCAHNFHCNNKTIKLNKQNDTYGLLQAVATCCYYMLLLKNAISAAPGRINPYRSPQRPRYRVSRAFKGNQRMALSAFLAEPE